MNRYREDIPILTKETLRDVGMSPKDIVLMKQPVSRNELLLWLESNIGGIFTGLFIEKEVAKGRLKTRKGFPRFFPSDVKDWIDLWDQTTDGFPRDLVGEAYYEVAKARREGKLKEKPCEVCGSLDYIAAHHEDYTRPLYIRWLCTRHHNRYHIALRSGKVSSLNQYVSDQKLLTNLAAEHQAQTTL